MENGKGSFSGAQDSARRGGTALMIALTKLTSLAESPSAEASGKPEITSISFSCVMSPQFAHIYVRCHKTNPEGSSGWYMAKSFWLPDC